MIVCLFVECIMTVLQMCLCRLGSNGGILSSSVECLSPMKSFSMHTPSLSGRMFENLDPSKKFSCCPQCTEKYEEELAKVVAGQTEKPSSEVKSDANQQSLPQWLQTAKRNTSDIIQVCP